MTTTTTQPNVRPCFSLQDAAQLAQTYYGITATAQELPSERDQNFYLKATSGQELVLKISGTAEEYAVLDFQNKAVAHLHAVTPELPCPQVWATKAGETIATVTGVNGANHFVRLLTYLSGKPLALVKPQAPELLRNLGAYLGKLDEALATFDHPATHRH